MTQSKLNLKAGIIGLGVGESHIEGYNSHPKCDVVALCDFSEEKLKIAERKYSGVKLTDSADKILEDPEVDIVSVASYDNFHFGQIVKAINNDKHVFAEKPLCLFPREAVRIKKALSEKPGVKIATNLVLRSSSRFKKLKEMIDNGDLGRCYYIEGDYIYGRFFKLTNGWRGDIDYYSIVLGGGVHIIDLILWLTGDKVEEVTASGNRICSENTKFAHNDLVVAILQFQSGMIAKVSCNFGCVYPHFHALSVFGDKATFVNSKGNALFYDSRDPLAKPKNITEPYPGVQKSDMVYAFVDSILNGSNAPITQKEIFDSLSVCFAIDEAIRRKEKIKVNYI